MLFPGGIREALHGKGEEYKLFWYVQELFSILYSYFSIFLLYTAATLMHTRVIYLIIKDVIKFVHSGQRRLILFVWLECSMPLLFPSAQ